MKSAIIITSTFLFIFMTSILNAQENEEVAMALMYIVAPTGEDEKDFNLAIEVCNCAIEKAKELFTQSKYEQFSKELIEFSKAWVKVMEDPANNLKAGPPRRSKELTLQLKELAPHIKTCAARVGVEVEF